MTPQQQKFIADLYAAYFSQVNAYIVAAVRDSERAKDITQDVFHEASKQAETLLTHENPGGWLMDAAKKKISTSNRALRRFIRRFTSLDEVTPKMLHIPADDAFEKIEKASEDPIQRIKEVLSEEEFSLLKRVSFDKAGHLKVSKELGISVWACQKRVSRIKNKLREAFPEYRKKTKKK